MANVSAAIRSSVRDVREFFALEEVERRSREVSAELRDKIAAAVPLADQRWRGADMLFTQGGYAEGLRLATEAYRAIRPLADELVGFDVPKIVLQVDATLGDELPTLDDEVRAEHRERFEQRMTAYRRLRSALVPFALDGAERSRMRKRRVGVLIALMAATLCVGVWMARRKTVSVEASANYGGRYLAENASDGIDHTHWLLPDKTLGWIDFKLSPPRKVSVVSILNGYEPPTYGVVDFRLEAWVGDKIVKTYDSTFRGQSPNPKPDFADVPFEVNQKVDKVRLVVKSSRDYGASLAEVVIR